MKRFIWFSLGIIALVLGMVGVVLPLLPTTPFILLAAFAFARSSTRMHGWLINHKVFGPLIEDWNTHGAIRPRAKKAAVISLIAVFTISVLLRVSPLVLGVQAVVLLASGIFIVTRPSGPR